MLSMHRTMLPQRYISDTMPSIPAGNCKHPTTLVAIAARQMTESRAFYDGVFG